MTDKPKVAGAKLGIGEIFWHRTDLNDEKVAVNGLTLAGEGFFHRLKRLYVWRAGRLPHDPSMICTDVGCKTVRSFNSALAELVDAGVVSVENGMIRFPYVDALIADVQESRDKKANAGSIGGNAKAEAARNIPETSPKFGPSLDEVSPELDFGSEQNQSLSPSNNNITTTYHKKEDSEAKASGAVAPSTVVEMSPVKALFDHGVRILTGCGKTENQARAIIASLRKAKGDAEAAGVLVAAEGKTNPSSYIYGAINRKDRHVPNGCRIDADGILCTGAAL